MRPRPCTVVSVSLSILLFLSSICAVKDSYAQSSSFIPSLDDNNLKVEPVITFPKSQVSIAFLRTNDMLVVEQHTGIVHRVVNGQLMKEPLLDVNVFNFQESGMLGIETTKNDNGKVYVFLYYTEAKLEDSSDQKKNIGNRLYRYELINNKLLNPKLLLSLPKGSGWHNGGAIKLGPDGNLYIPVGELSSGDGVIRNATLAQNNQDGLRPNLSGGILRVTQDGRPVDTIIGDSFPESLYFAYGIRNSFGIDFDPITGNMWDTENGPSFGDEVNLVRAGFNSGWSKVQGIWKPTENLTIGEIFSNPEDLVNFSGKVRYSSPEFTWQDTVGPTAIKFLRTPKLGDQYENDIFVGDMNGRLYHFDLNENRTGLQLNGELSDKVANRSTELAPLIFGKGFIGISDLEIGPDGYLYVVSYGGYQCSPTNGEILPDYQGAIFKVSPKAQSSKIYNDISNPVDGVLKISMPVYTVLEDKITNNKISKSTLNHTSVPIIGDDDTILLEDETRWSGPLNQSATYIEGSFRIIHDKNETDKDNHAGLVWQEGSNKTYYAFVRPGKIVLSDSISEISCGDLIVDNEENWNRIMIINSGKSIYVYYNDTLRIKVPREFNGTDISLVGTRSINAKAEFVPIKIGHFNQSLSKYLLPNIAVSVNENKY